LLKKVSSGSSLSLLKAIRGILQYILSRTPVTEEDLLEILLVPRQTGLIL
jgi:hypothetical protein